MEDLFLEGGQLGWGMWREMWIPCQISFREEMAVRSWPVSLQKTAKAMACEAPW